MTTANPLTAEDVALLNSPRGLKQLMASPDVDAHRALEAIRHDEQMVAAHVELIHLQHWVIETRQRVVVLFEGRDAAGKGGTIRRLTAHINPRHFRSYALPKPTEDERGQWYFQRYVGCLPNPGEIAFFDRSWYNRAMVEPVNGFCTEDEYEQFMAEVNDFEKMIVNSGVYLIKFYLSINRDEQSRRLKAVRKSPLKKWRLSKVDEQAQDLWDSYTDYKDKMLARSHSEHAPWVVIDANHNDQAHLVVARHILGVIPYEVIEQPVD